MSMMANIDESIKKFSKWREALNYDHNDCCYGSDITTNSLDVVIAIMHNYQKIQEIIEAWKADTWTDGVSYDCMVKINEVLEDGNVD